MTTSFWKRKKWNLRRKCQIYLLNCHLFTLQSDGRTVFPASCWLSFSCCHKDYQLTNASVKSECYFTVLCSLVLLASILLSSFLSPLAFRCEHDKYFIGPWSQNLQFGAVSFEDREKPSQLRKCCCRKGMWSPLWYCLDLLFRGVVARFFQLLSEMSLGCLVAALACGAAEGMGIEYASLGKSKACAVCLVYSTKYIDNIEICGILIEKTKNFQNVAPILVDLLLGHL